MTELIEYPIEYIQSLHDKELNQYCALYYIRGTFPKGIQGTFLKGDDVWGGVPCQLYPSYQFTAKNDLEAQEMAKQYQENLQKEYDHLKPNKDAAEIVTLDELIRIDTTLTTILVKNKGG